MLAEMDRARQAALRDVQVRPKIPPRHAGSKHAAKKRSEPGGLIAFATHRIFRRRLRHRQQSAQTRSYQQPTSTDEKTDTYSAKIRRNRLGKLRSD